MRCAPLGAIFLFFFSTLITNAAALARVDTRTASARAAARRHSLQRGGDSNTVFLASQALMEREDTANTNRVVVARTEEAAWTAQAAAQAVKTTSTETRRKDKSQETPLQRLLDELWEVVDYMQHIHKLPGRIWDATKREILLFLPGWKFQPETFVACFLTISFSLVGFLIYHNFIYENDRTEHLERWSQKLEAVESEEYGDFNPDFIVVAYHPSADFKEDKEIKTLEHMTKVLKPDAAAEEAFPQLAEARQHASGEVHRLQMSPRLLQKFHGGDVGAAGADGSNTLCMKDARRAFLIDVYHFFERQGFSTSAFASMEMDLLFVCASLRRPQSINYYLDRDNRPLQLRGDVVANLKDRGKDVIQDSQNSAYSPPLMAYSADIVDTLASDDAVSFQEREHSVFRTYRRAGKDLHICSKEAVEIITKELTQHLNLDVAVEEKLCADFFPCHDRRNVARFKAIWANWLALKDLSFVQPVSYIREYFGARLAFFFAWNGLHCKALVVLVALSLSWVLITFFFKYALGSKLLSHRQVIGFCIVISVWSKVVNNMWKREEMFFEELWGLRLEALSDTPRPDFQGDFEPSLLNASIMEKQYPRKKAMLRRTLTAIATLLFCTMVCFVIYAWRSMFRGRMGLVSSTILALLIKVFTMVFESIVPKLVEFENHKYQEDFFNSYVWKLFVFDYVNNYSAFFFLTITKAECSEGLSEHDCSGRTLMVLRGQVTTTLAVLVVVSILEVIGESYMIKFWDWWEDYQYRKKFGEDPPVRSFLEEQKKYEKVDIATEVHNVMNLMLTLGFTLHFGGVSPGALVFTLAVFAVKLRAFAIHCVTDAQRVMPQRSHGLGGAWSDIVRFLMVSGVMYTAFLFVTYGISLEGALLSAKLACFGAFCFGIFVTWSIVDMIYPAKDEDAELLQQRRDYVATLVQRMAHKGELPEHIETNPDFDEVQQSISVDTQGWNKFTRRSDSRADIPG